MKTLSLLLAPLLAIGLLANTALGQVQDSGMALSERRPVHARSGGGWRRGRGMERMKERLGLSDEQTRQIRAILREARKTSIKTRADLRIARIELGELVTQEKVDKGKIDAKLGQIGQLTQQRLRLRTDVVLATRDVLTPEQMKNADRWFMRFLSGRRWRGRRG
ncbi:MAG: Spy/CpxP family protein refolding chaperone, partial [Candidatus Binatia bacterium]